MNDLKCVHVAGNLRHRHDDLVLDICSPQETQGQPGDIVRLIPESICPVPWLLAYLDALTASLTIPPLQKFLSRVFSNDGLAFLFVSAPASLRHHHNYPGGLLRHSLECAQSISRQTQFAVAQRELGIVAALLHDIGKIQTITSRMKRTSLGRVVDHDKLTLEILAPYLKELDQAWPEGSAELRYLLTWRKGRKDSPIPRWAIAEMVCCADRVSTGLAVGE